MTPADPLEDLCGTTLEGRFTLDAFVARGGYGVVYRGTHLALRCPVAVKVLAVPERLEGSARARFVEAFEREARTAAVLRHPAIVGVHDFGVTTVGDRAHPYMVLEWIDGETLEAALAAHEGATRSPRETLRLLRPVLDAMASAHEAGVAHRDIKPANVMVTTTRRGARTTRLLDFGLAKALDPDEAPPTGLTHTGEDRPAFSLSHAAPEQVGRLRTGPWTDVHALALLVVEVLTGRRAYQGETSVDLFARITSETRPTPRTLSYDAGPWEPVLARALARSPAERHPDAAALLADLEAHVDEAQRAWEGGATVEAPAVTAAPRRRPPRGVGLVVLAGAVAVGLWSLRASSQRAARPSPGAPSPAGALVRPEPPRAPPTARGDAAATAARTHEASPGAALPSTPADRPASAPARLRRTSGARRGASVVGDIEIE